MTPLDYLLSLEHFGIKLGLRNITRLLQKAGSPQSAYPCLHIGGTNGKGSTAAIVAAVARAAGYSVGRFTSPHLVSVHERFIIDGSPISPSELDEQIAWFRPIIETLETPPTFFELNTAIALRWFMQRSVDLAVIEVGMGGRLDSTNIITPAAAAITTVDMDHMQHLGDTLEKIAHEKAGIIKPGVPVIIGETKPDAQCVLLNRAQQIGAPVRLLDREFTYATTGSPTGLSLSYKSDSLTLPPTPLTLPGKHQAHNAACAVALIEQIRPHFPRLDADAIATGLAGVRWPCRLETVLRNPTVVIDVAHNPAGARAVAECLEPGITILAVSSDKDAHVIIDALAPITALFIFTQFSGARALPVDALCEMADSRPHRKTSSLREAIDLGFQLAGKQTPLLITGSFYTAGQARQILTDHYGAPPLRF